MCLYVAGARPEERTERVVGVAVEDSIIMVVCSRVDGFFFVSCVDALWEQTCRNNQRTQLYWEGETRFKLLSHVTHPSDILEPKSVGQHCKLSTV